MKWICCQLGAREHYSVPRALHSSGHLEQLITDAWSPSGRRVPAIFFAGLRERYHEDLRFAPVKSFTCELLRFEIAARTKKLAGWKVIMARNEWFQQKAVSALRDKEITRPPDNTTTLFAYSYAAREILRFAKKRGWRTVLGQIDAGPIEEQIVAEEVARVPKLAPNWEPAPSEYWEQWREECQLADRIVANSEWSRACLQKAGIDIAKLAIVPLTFEPGGPQSRATTGRPDKNYPAQFTSERPLRILFLGQVNLRKGVARLIDAIRMLQDRPIEFQFVGPIQISIPPDLIKHPRVRWIGAVARREVTSFYQSADVMIFPTLSDGFGLTQLEAQAWKLPVVASRNCGAVVRHGQNGLLLEQPATGPIVSALQFCFDNPAELAEFSSRSGLGAKWSLSSLGNALQTL